MRERTWLHGKMAEFKVEEAALNHPSQRTLPVAIVGRAKSCQESKKDSWKKYA